jgi:hypothetical protein
MKNLEKDLKSPSTEEIPSDSTYHAQASDHRSASNNRNAQPPHMPSNLSLLVGTEHHMRPVPSSLVPYIEVLRILVKIKGIFAIVSIGMASYHSCLSDQDQG